MQKNELIKTQITSLEIYDNWLEKKALKESAVQQFDMVDFQFKKALKEVFEKFGIKRFDDDYIQVVLRDGYYRESLDKEKVLELLDELGLIKDDYMNKKFIDSTITIKEKQ